MLPVSRFIVPPAVWLKLDDAQPVLTVSPATGVGTLPLQLAVLLQFGFTPVFQEALLRAV